MKREFVKLIKLVDLTYEGDTAESNARWLRNVHNTGVAEGYTYAGDDGYDSDEFACDEMEFADVKVYNFMGSAYEDERFYERDIVTYKHKATGDYYVLYEEDLDSF